MYHVKARQNPMYTFRETINLGKSSLDRAQVRAGLEGGGAGSERGGLEGRGAGSEIEAWKAEEQFVTDG